MLRMLLRNDPSLNSCVPNTKLTLTHARAQVNGTTATEFAIDSSELKKRQRTRQTYTLCLFFRCPYGCMRSPFWRRGQR